MKQLFTSSHGDSYVNMLYRKILALFAILLQGLPVRETRKPISQFIMRTFSLIAFMALGMSVVHAETVLYSGTLQGNATTITISPADNNYIQVAGYNGQDFDDAGYMKFGAANDNRYLLLKFGSSVQVGHKLRITAYSTENGLAAGIRFLNNSGTEIINVSDGTLDNKQTKEISIDLTQTVVDEAKANGIKLVYYGSTKLHFNHFKIVDPNGSTPTPDPGATPDFTWIPNADCANSGADVTHNGSKCVPFDHLDCNDADHHYFSVTHYKADKYDEPDVGKKYHGIKANTAIPIVLRNGVPVGGMYMKLFSAYPGTAKIEMLGSGDGRLVIVKVTSSGVVSSETTDHNIIYGAETYNLTIDAFTSYYLYAAAGGNNILFTQIDFYKGDSPASPTPEVTTHNNAAIPNREALLSNTKVYDPDARDIFETQTKYYRKALEAGILTIVVDDPQKNVYRTTNDYDDFLLSAWKIGEGDGAISADPNDFGKALYINTWSPEGDSDNSGFSIPFFEYYVGGGTLPPKTFTATVEGVKPNACYSVSAKIRLREKDGTANTPLYGVSLQVGDGDPVLFADHATQVLENSSPNEFNIATLTAIGQADGDGKITIKISVAADNNTHWLSFKDITYAEYTDITFVKKSVIYDFNNTFQKAQGTVTRYEIVEKFGDLKNSGLSIDVNGAISGLPSSFGKNVGGAVTIKAIGANGKEDEYVLTVPYKSHVWDFYSDKDDNHSSVLEFGPAVQNQSPGSASQFIETPYAETSDEKYDFASGYSYEARTTDGVKISSSIFNQDYYDGLNKDEKKVIDSQRNLYRSLLYESAWEMKYDPNPLDPTVEAERKKIRFKYWDYDFKIRSHYKDTSTNPVTNKPTWVTDTNKPILVYRGAVNGDNARIVTNTAGLVFNCANKAFAVNDHEGETGEKEKDCETDRAIILEKRSSFTIPHVKKGHYVKLYWYRHSDHAGDMFSVTNAKDLDGTPINPTEILRFTGAHYEDFKGQTTAGGKVLDNRYRGCTFFCANPPGEEEYCDITITIQNNCWTELYSIEVTDLFVTDLRIMATHLEKNEGSRSFFGGKWCHNLTKFDQTIGNITSWDLQDYVINVVRDASNTDDYVVANLRETGPLNKDLEETDKLAKLQDEQFGDNPLIYISCVPGESGTWNGWEPEVTVSVVDHDRDRLKAPLVFPAWVRVGNNTSYKVQGITNFHGTGTVHVTMKTKSKIVDPSDYGDLSKDNPGYVLDVQEAYFPVGEYRPQTYPYTWDFTAKNMGDRYKRNKELGYGEVKTMARISATTDYDYGKWQTDAPKSYLRSLNEVSPTVPTWDNGGSNKTYVKNDNSYYNKYLFADGAELVANVNGYNSGVPENALYYIAEAEGLRFRLEKEAHPTTIEYNQITDGKGDQVGTYNKGVAMDGNVLRVSNATITIPQVNDGMYIFIKNNNKKPEYVCYKRTDINALTWVKPQEEKTSENTTIGGGKDCISHIGKATNNVIYGNDASVNYMDGEVKKKQHLSYTDIKGYDQIRVYGTAEEGTIIRAIINREEIVGDDYPETQDDVALYTHSAPLENGVAIIDVSNINSEEVRLNFIKAAWDATLDGFPTVNISNIELIQGVVPEVRDDGNELIKEEDDGFIDSDNPVKVKFMDSDIKDDVYVYKIDHRESDPKDVHVAFVDDTEISMIGVTDEFKMMTNTDGESTESRRLRVNYDYSGEFTKHALTAYKGTTAIKESCGHPAAPGQTLCEECGALTLTPIAVVPGTSTGNPEEKNNSTTPNNDGKTIDNGSLRGLVLHEDTPSGSKIDLIPLFVPANNQEYGSLSGNLLQHVIDKNFNIPPTEYGSEDGAMNYVYTNEYFRPSNNQWHTDGKNYNFYIIRQGGPSRPHAAYLTINRKTGWTGIGGSAKRFYIYYGDADEETGIEDITMPDEESDGMGINLDDAEIYTLSGIKLQGLPTQKGVYIINGKKVMVK